MKRLLPILLLVMMLLTACSTPTPAATPSDPAPTTAPPTSLPPTQPAPTDTAPAPTDVPTLPPTTAATQAPSATPTEGPTATPAVAYMTLQDFTIVPAALKITTGTKVIFLIKSTSGALHQPYSSFPGSFDLSGLFEGPANLGDGTSYSYTFTRPGIYTVRCGFHPGEMVATIEVTP